MNGYLDIEDLEVYQKLCELHLEVCELSHEWPVQEKYELASPGWPAEVSLSS